MRRLLKSAVLCILMLSILYVPALQAQWIENGIALCTANARQANPEIAADGAGGAIILWEDKRISRADIFLQRVDASGDVLWTAGGVAVSLQIASRYLPQIVSDGSNGDVIAWSGSGAGVYAQRLDAAGNRLWTDNGIVVSAAGTIQSTTSIASDADGGAIIAWNDFRDGNYDIYAQRVDAAGNVLWTANGLPVCTAAHDQIAAQIVSDGASGGILVWQDYRIASYPQYWNIYAQRVDASGNALWTANGIPICTENDVQESCNPVSDGAGGAGGAIVVWHDRRSMVSLHDIYAQRMERHGYWGYPAADIAHVRDIPNDQGGFVKIVWDASRLDALPDETISRYTVWRRGSETDFQWELIDSIEAIATLQYADTVQTLSDSTAADPALSYFQVIAHTSDPETFWISTPDSGSSIDNLAPMPPSGLAGGG